MSSPPAWAPWHFGRDVGLVMLTSALIGFTIFGGIYSVLFNLYLLRMGYGPEFVGGVNAAGALAFVLFSLPASAWGNRWGNRRLMIIGLATATIGHIGVTQAEFFADPVRSLWLLGSNALGSAGLNIFFVNVFPYLTRVTQPAQRHRIFAIQVALWPLAGFAGSLLGGFLPGLTAALLDLAPEGPVAYRYPLLLGALLLGLAAASIRLTREAGPPAKATVVSSGEKPPYTLMIFMGLTTFFQTAGEGTVRTFYNVYLDTSLHLPTPIIGAFTSAGQLLAVVCALSAPPLAARWGRRQLIVTGSVAMTFCLLPLALITHWTAAAFGFIGLVAMGAFRRPIYIVFQQESVPQHWRASMSGAVSLAYGISSAGIALGGGYMVAFWSFKSLFLAAAALTAVGGLLFWYYFRVPRGEYANGPG